MKGKERPTRQVLAWLLGITKKKNPWVLVMVGLQILLGAVGVAQVWFLRGMIDMAVARDNAGFIRRSVEFLLLLFAVVALNALLRFLRERLLVGTRSVLRERLFGTILTREYAGVSAVHSGEWMSRLMWDVDTIASGLVDILPDASGMLVRLLGALGMIFWLLPGYILIIVPVTAALTAATFLLRKRLKSRYKKMREADGRLRVFFTERITSLLVVRAFGREEASLEGARERMEEYRGAHMRHANFANLCNTALGIAIRGFYGASAVVCAHGILRGTVTYGTFTAILQLIGQIQGPFASLSTYLPKFYNMIASAERLMDVEDLAPDMTEERKTAEDAARLYREELAAVRMDRVSFTYPAVDPEDRERAMRKTLPEVDLTIGKGEFVAITGHSGCGKSTLLRLLLCVYPPDEGEILLEKKDGSAEPLTAAWRGLFAYVPQGNHLISGTIRDVVTFGDSSPDDARVWEALELACAAEFVRQIPEGLDLALGERGSGLSEGQVQRIAIARALYAGRPILLLDEATSSLDEATEEQMLENLRRMTDRTVIVVTHRPRALSLCDQQVHMTEEGVERIDRRAGNAD